MKKLNGMEQKAGSKVLDELRAHAQKLMSGKMKGLKKVTVASDSPEGLKKGLNVAEDMLGKDSELTKSPLGEVLGNKSKIGKSHESHPSEIEGLEEQDHEDLESDEFEAGEAEGEEEQMSEEELDAKIKELMQLKAKMHK